MIVVVTHDADLPAILVGAFDRHNFGDLLFPHIATALAGPAGTVFAGLAQRDLRAVGGHQVQALTQLATERPVNILHAGGELLTCDAWQAAVMLLPPEQAQDIIARLDRRPLQGMEWAREMLEMPDRAPYTVSRELFPRAAAIAYNAVGGVGFGELGPATRAEVSAKLRDADLVTVRDRHTQSLLAAEGIAAPLMPDAAVMVAELFGARIAEHARNGEVARILQAFPNGYVAVQFSADFGDDATLAQIAAQLDRIADASGYGVAFFRAGSAPWHDDLLVYERVATRMRTPSARIFSSLNLWDICALIASSRGYCGSSLHGRIVAMAFALPRINLLPPIQATQPTKHAAFAATWEEQGIPATVEVHSMADGFRDALATDPEQRRHTAAGLATRYRRDYAAVRAALRGAHA